MNIDFDRLKYSLTGEYDEIILEKQLEQKTKEIERTNNIIEELEKYLKEQIQKSWEIEEQCYENVYNYLQELKEKQ